MVHATEPDNRIICSNCNGECSTDTGHTICGYCLGTGYRTLSLNRTLDDLAAAWDEIAVLLDTIEAQDVKMAHLENDVEHFRKQLECNDG